MTSIADKRSGSQVSMTKRRFPEFQEAGPWKTVTLGSVASISTKKVGEKKCIPMSITSGVGLVSQMEKFGRIIAGDSYKNYLLLQKNDFAYNKSATKEYPEGFIALYTGEELAAVPNSIFTCFRIKDASLSPKYLNYLLHGNLHGRWLRKFIEVGARAHGSLSINDRDLLAMPVPIPGGSLSLQEQEKIADCLASADALIEAQGRKVAALKAHKKGLMQQLFPQEGETLPRIRFPGFEGSGEWVEEPLNSCLIKVIDYRGKAPPKSESGVPLITAKNVRPGWLDMRNDEYIDGDQYDSWMSRGIPKPGDVLFTTEAPLGNVALFPRTGKFAVGQRLLTLRANPKKCLSDFLFQSLLGPRMQREIDYNSTGSTARGIKSSVFVKLPLIHPRDIGEQQRIADCLTFLDDLIAAEARRLGTLVTHKKGLMQQLLLQVEEDDV